MRELGLDPRADGRWVGLGVESFKAPEGRFHLREAVVGPGMTSPAFRVSLGTLVRRI
jgi:hypothetical protein